MQYWSLGSAACLIAILISSPARARAAAVDGKRCGKACRQTYRTLKFEDAPKGVFFGVQECTSRLYQQSIYLCWDIHCAKEVWLAESASMNKTCQNIDESYYLAPHNIIDGLTDEDVAHITRFNATSPGRTQAFDKLMLPSQDFYDLWRRTLVSTPFKSEKSI
ncbi:hypothetical protein NW762_012765 [Fusarium torreyae]|uniref:Secreted protein n=1 Tax=Fusarium torreyae TaxID=1237075 RepID=A0A9W8VB24_9HYPO|nr:hypothetical protein NW762_012765 [Fusarium torreyae]